MNPNPSELLHGLPGAERILEGLRDYQENRLTVAACLVRMARHRLGKAGLMEDSPPRDDGAELDLYHLLSHGILSAQVLAGFYVNAAAKFKLPEDTVTRILESLENYPVLPISEAVF